MQEGLRSGLDQCYAQNKRKSRVVEITGSEMKKATPSSRRAASTLVYAYPRTADVLSGAALLEGSVAGSQSRRLAAERGTVDRSP